MRCKAPEISRDPLKNFLDTNGQYYLFMTKNGMCTHQVHARRRMKNTYFCGSWFFVFSWTDDFVADFLPCAWCLHIFIGVLGGSSVAGGPFSATDGVPSSPSRIWRLLKFLKFFENFENFRFLKNFRIFDILKSEKNFEKVFVPCGWSSCV